MKKEEVSRIQNRIMVALMGMTLIGGMLTYMLRPQDEISLSERRKLAQRPELNAEAIWKGKYMEEFEKYAADQFPMREEFRSISSVFSYYVLQKKDVNDIYVVDKMAEKLEPSISEESVEWGINRFQFLQDNYFQPAEGIAPKVYFAVVPDKNYYLAKDNGYPYMDYDALCQQYRQALGESVTWIDLTETLGQNSFYRTDPHWKQEEILPAYQKLIKSMQGGEQAVKAVGDFETVVGNDKFYGSLYGQAALPLPPDQLKYLTNASYANMKVACMDTGKPVEMPVYDMEKATDKDPYEMYLGGSKALITIENPDADTDRELILFRDSFGSSMAPLLALNYRKVTLVDIRYISPAMLGRLIDFKDKDVLLMYSVQVLNHTKGQFVK